MSEAAASRPNLPEYTVSEIAGALKRTVEDAFPFVRVRGEISNLKFHSSGHIYFDLKDEKARLNAVVWRMTARLLKTKPEQGLEVVCTGRVTTYPGSSRYQIVVEQIELAGIGALMAMLEERKKRLAAEGIFDRSRKRPLPFLPEVIGVVTSPTGAVIRDIMHRLAARFPRRVLVWPVAVQGERAAAEVAAAIRGFNALPADGHLPRPNLLIVARGGGSIEDLMAFNEEIVVRAAGESEIPVISAVGHETDTTLIDFAADARAPTPTAAAEMAVPVRAELLSQVLDFERRVINCFLRGVTQRRNQVAALARVLPRSDQFFSQVRQRFDYASERLPQALHRNLQVHRRKWTETAASLRPLTLKRQIAVCGERVSALGQRLLRRERARMAERQAKLDGFGRILESVSYVSVLERGFALVRGNDGSLRRRAAAVRSGEELIVTFADESTSAVAIGPPRQPLHRSGRPKKVAKEQDSLF
jgi:exodeoxyribonuclease VII large subunit